MAGRDMLLTAKIGVCNDGKEKFESWSNKCGYYEKAVDGTNYTTDNMRTGSFSRTDSQQNKVICDSLRERNKNQVERKSGSASKQSPLTFPNETTSDLFSPQTLLKFQDFFKQYSRLKDIDDFQIELPLLKTLLLHCLNTSCDPYLFDKVITTSETLSNNGCVSWCVFRDEVLPTVRVSRSARKSIPERSKLVDANLGPQQDFFTTYRSTFNKPDLISIVGGDKLISVKTRDNNNGSSANWSSSNMLNAGTVKSTSQIPGYKGHIPSNVRNIKKYAHSRGNLCHPVENNLRLTQRGIGCVVGYTGHVPYELQGVSRERTTACDSRTSNGAAYGETRVPL